MSKIFISHSSRNNAIALAMARWLELRGWGDYFLDISADRGLSPGERWQAALKVAADRCEAVVFLISPAWRESRWCIAELLLAQQLGKAVFGAIVEPVELETIPAGMSSQWQLTNLIEGQDRLDFRVELDPVVPRTEVSFAAAGLDRLERGLRQAGLDPSTFPWPPAGREDRLPYQGLKAMDVEDAPIFFGREAAIITALDTLRRLRQGTAERMFVIVGASGAGKSSFLRAGLLSRLQRDDRHFLTLPVVRPEKAVIHGPNGLVPSLETALSRLRIPESRAGLREKLRSPSGFAGLLARLQSAAHARFTSDAAPAPTIVLPIDQTEELYTSEAGDEARRFLELLRSLLSPPGQGRDPSLQDPQVPFVLLSIRSDSYERLQTDPLLEPVKQYLFSLPPVPREAYTAIIEGPAARHTTARRRLSIDPLLTRRLLDDAGGADALPLLAFTLERLLLEYGGDGELSLTDYQALGGIEGSIEAAIQAAFADPDRSPRIPSDPEEREALLRQGLVPWLARIDPDTEERKRRIASWAKIPSPARPLLERLVEQRLLVRDRRPTEDDETQTVVVEVAHEALLRRWPLLSRWLDEEAEALKAIEGARRAADEWVRHGRQDAWLIHGEERLRGVEVLLRQSAFDSLLASRGREYLRACRDREELERLAEEERKEREEEQERRAREAEQAAERERLRVAEVEAEQARERENAARRLSRRTLAGAAVVLVLMLAAVGAAWRAAKQQEEAEQTLGASDVAEALRRQGNGRVGESVAYLARAVRLVPGEVPWRTFLVNALISTRWLLPKAEIRMPDETTSATFSPDGRALLIVAGDSARLWNVATGKKIADLRHRNSVLSTQFSLDGRRVVTGSRDRTVRVWEVAGGELVREMRTGGAVVRVSFLGSSRSVVAEVYGGETYVFDVATGQSLRPKPLEGRPAVSPDRRYFVFSTGNDVEIWDTKNQSRTRKPVGPRDRWGDIEFAPDSRSFLIPTEKELVYADAEGGVPTVLAPVDYRYKYNGTGRAAVFWDGRQAIGFDFRARTKTGPWIAFESGTIATARVNDDASRIVTAWLSEPEDEDSEPPRKERYRVQVWDAASGAEIGASIDRPSDDQPAFCPNGKRFITRDGSTVSTWDTASGERIGRPIALARAALSLLRIDDDCRYALAASRFEAHLWGLERGAPAGEPLIHEAEVLDAVFSPDGIHLATVTPRGVRVWDLRSGAAVPQPLTPAGIPSRSELKDDYSSPELAVSSDARRSAFVADHEIVLHDRVTGVRSELPLPLGRVAAYAAFPLEFSRNGRRLIVRFWNEEDIEVIRVSSVDGGGWIGHPIPNGGGAALSPDGTSVVAWSGKFARIWKVETGKPVGKLIRHRHAIKSAVFSDDGQWIAIASSDGAARVWSALTGEARGEPMRLQRYASRVAFSGNGKYLLTVGRIPRLTEGLDWEDREVRVWRVSGGEPVTDSKLYGQEITDALINADGSRAVTLVGNTATLWDPATGAAVGAALEHDEKVLTAAFSPDGKRLATVAGRVIRLWDAVRSLPISFPMENVDAPHYVSFTPDGQRLLAASDWEAWIWDAASVSEDDVPLLAEVAEVVSGLRITDLGAIEPLPDATARLAQLRERLATPAGSGPESAGRKIARWLLMDPQRRAPTPLADAQPPEAASPRSRPGAPSGG